MSIAMALQKYRERVNHGSTADRYAYYLADGAQVALMAGDEWQDARCAYR